MVSPPARSPAEFGNELRELRVAAGVELEAISERTKIGRRTLEAIESGEFAKLPDKVFVRMFVQQIVEIVGGDRDLWLASFEGAWDRFVRGSQQVSVPSDGEPRPRRALGPWIVGILLVTVALTVLFVLQRRTGEKGAEVELPTPTVVATILAPAPAEDTALATQATPVPTEVPPPAGDLVFVTAASECWVQVVIGAGAASSRLLPPESRWEVELGPASAEITIGAVGSVAVTYKGTPVPVPGRPGSVAHLRIPPPES